MRAEYHAALGGIASGGLAPVLGVYSLIFFAASVLVDFDHYLDYIYRNRFTDFSVRRMFRFNTALAQWARGKPCVQLSVFHTIEFLLLVYVVAALTGWSPLYAVLWGLLFHMVLDLTDLFLKRAFFARALSLVEYAFRLTRLRKQGLQPDLPFEMAMKDTFAELENVDKAED